MKKYMTIDEMNAIRTHYYKPFRKRDFLKMALVPMVYCGSLLFLTTYYWWLGIIGLIGGLSYSFFVYIPTKIRTEHERTALRMRNRFIGNIAQSINRQNATVVDTLRDVSDFRLEGELKQDVNLLIHEIQGAASEQRKEAYYKFMSKYESDVIFTHFMEHLLTLDLNGKGKNDSTALDETAELHNSMIERQDDFIDGKGIKILYYKVNTIIGFVIVIFFQGLSTFIITWDGFISNFAHALVGYLFSAFFLGMSFYFAHKCVITSSDETLQEGKL